MSAVLVRTDDYDVEGPVSIAGSLGASADWVQIGEQLVHVETLPTLIEALQRIQAEVHHAH